MSGELLTADQALIARLQDEVSQLRRDLVEKDQVIAALEASTGRAVKNLRRQLTPLYTALRQVFGEIDVLDPDASEDVGVAPSGRVTQVWSDWKSKLPNSCGKVIDALLLHGPLNQQQICVSARISPNTLSGGTGVIARMNKAGLWTKGSDGKYTLRTF